MTLWPDPSTIEGISDHQREAYANASRSSVGVLTGGPGTGKTFTAARVLQSIADTHGIGNIAVAAPTGKAAVRITEAMQENGLDLSATTIHRLLEVGRNGHDGNGWGFLRDAGNPLDQRFVVVDEPSMLDTNLAANLFAACAHGTHVLFTGDTGQLPPVGHGAPLRDMIAAGVPHGELTEVRRNAGDIVSACAAMRAGKSFRPSEKVDVESGHNWKHFECPTAGMTLKSLRQFFDRPFNKFDRVWDVQVLCALNESGEFNRKKLNQGLQQILNPAGETLDGNPFRMGDKVICTKNSMIPLAEDKEISDFVANGEIGKVVGLGKRKVVVEFEKPARTVEAVGELYLAFELAYAVTVHKSQGSQWPVVVVLIDDSRAASRVCSREFWYTAVSRMQKLCVTMGKWSVLEGHCRNVVLPKRKTFLMEQLQESIA